MLAAISVTTLLPIALLVLTLVGWFHNTSGGVSHTWMIASLLLSGFVTVVGIQEAMSAIHRRGSVIRCVAAIVAIFCGTAAAGMALTLGLPLSISCDMGMGRMVRDIRILKAQLEEYRKRNGVYPPTEQWSPQALEQWSEAIGVNFKDPFGRDYVYRYPGKRDPNSFDLFSAGPDRVGDTMDDEWGK